jgi:hypothetical protein
MKRAMRSSARSHLRIAAPTRVASQALILIDCTRGVDGGGVNLARPVVQWPHPWLPLVFLSGMTLINVPETQPSQNGVCMLRERDILMLP